MHGTFFTASVGLTLIAFGTCWQISEKLWKRVLRGIAWKRSRIGRMPIESAKVNSSRRHFKRPNGSFGLEVLEKADDAFAQFGQQSKTWDHIKAVFEKFLRPLVQTRNQETPETTFTKLASKKASTIWRKAKRQPRLFEYFWVHSMPNLKIKWRHIVLFYHKKAPVQSSAVWNEGQFRRSCNLAKEIKLGWLPWARHLWVFVSFEVLTNN